MLGPIIVAVAGGKGGAGKTTVSVNLASEMQRRGRRVLLVDADPQGTTTEWFRVAAENKRAAPTCVRMQAAMDRHDQLPRMARNFDVVVIDGPPRIGEIQRSMLALADLVLFPCAPTAADVWALPQSLAMLEAAQQLRPSLRGAVVLVRTMARSSATASVRRELQRSKVPVLSAELGQRVAFCEAMAAGLGVTTYQPRGRAAEEVTALIEEIQRLRRRSLSAAPPMREAVAV